jgi:hypothetical protein
MRLIGPALIVLAMCSAPATAETPVAGVSQLQLYSSFWQNLHHFLSASASIRARVGQAIA